MEDQLNSPVQETAISADTTPRAAALVKGLIVLLVLAAVALAWRLSPISEWMDSDAVIAWQESVKSHPAALFLVVAAYLLASLVLFPVTILNIAMIVTFGPILGNAYSLAGWLAAAAMGYGIGRSMSRNLLRKITSPRLDRLLRRAEGHGLASVLTVRLLPVAPFSVINLFIGASRIRFRDFMLASVIGRIPGMIMLAFVGIQFDNLLRHPGTASLVLLGLTLILVPLATAWLSKRVGSNDELERDSSQR
jgi:phospholipase D1/2